MCFFCIIKVGLDRTQNRIYIFYTPPVCTHSERPYLQHAHCSAIILSAEYKTEKMCVCGPSMQHNCICWMCSICMFTSQTCPLPPNAINCIWVFHFVFVYFWCSIHIFTWPMQHNCIWICSIRMFTSQTCPTPAHPHTISPIWVFVHFCGCICIFTWPMQHNCIWICSICMFTSKTCSPYFPSSPISF